MGLKSKVVPAPHHEDMLRRGGKAPRIFNFDTRCR